LMDNFVYLVLLKAIIEAQIEAMGMMAENKVRELNGLQVAHDEQSFCDIRDRLNAIWEANRP
jgi:hypothetical protein